MTFSVKCVADIDECESTVPVCGPLQDCINTRGSYECICPPGLQGRDCDTLDGEHLRQ